VEENIFSVTLGEHNLEVSSVTKTGSSEWIIALHGIQSSKELFSDFSKQSFLKNYSFLAMDLIGFGESSKPESFSYDIADQAKTIKQIVRRLGIEKVHIIGHSLGGAVGTILLKPLQDIIISFINLEGNLTLADSSITKEVVGYSFDEFRKEKYQQIKDSIKNSDELSAGFRSRCLEKVPDYTFYKTSQSIIKWISDNELLRLFKDSSCKRLYIYGDKNAFKKSIVPVNVQKIEIPNAGHFMLLDNAEATYTAIEDFLNR